MIPSVLFEYLSVLTVTFGDEDIEPIEVHTEKGEISGKFCVESRMMKFDHVIFGKFEFDGRKLNFRLLKCVFRASGKERKMSFVTSSDHGLDIGLMNAHLTDFFGL